jgi:hypothetical protein
MAFSLAKITSLLRRRPYKVFTPRHADKVNDWMLRRSRDYGGGTVVLKGWHEPSEGYRIQPGIILYTPSHPTMYSKVADGVRTTRLPDGDPIFTFTDGVDFGSRKAWGGAALRDVQVDPQTEGHTLIDLVGGNGSDIRNVSSAMGRYPLEFGIVTANGREHDGQYSTFDRVRLTRVIHAVEWTKNCPDCVISNSMFYGDRSEERREETTSLVAEGKNLTVRETSWQFVAKGPQINTLEFESHGGQWENGSGESVFADYAFSVGPNVEDMTVRSLSMANFESLRDRRVFDLDPAASGYTFEYLSGHVNRSHVPAGFEDHFVWHKA